MMFGLSLWAEEADKNIEENMKKNGGKPNADNVQIVKDNFFEQKRRK